MREEIFDVDGTPMHVDRFDVERFNGVDAISLRIKHSVLGVREALAKRGYRTMPPVTYRYAGNGNTIIAFHDFYTDVELARIAYKIEETRFDITVSSTLLDDEDLSF